jgi:hypothetical protein
VHLRGRLGAAEFQISGLHMFPQIVRCLFTKGAILNPHLFLCGDLMLRAGFFGNLIKSEPLTPKAAAMLENAGAERTHLTFERKSF